MMEASLRRDARHQVQNHQVHSLIAAILRLMGGRELVPLLTCAIVEAPENRYFTPVLGFNPTGFPLYKTQCDLEDDRDKSHVFRRN